MKLARMRLLWILALLAVPRTVPVSAHPTDLAPPPPTTYAGAVQRIRETMRSIEEARQLGDSPDASIHCGELAGLARLVPAFSVSVVSAFEDSAVGRVMRAGARVGALALEAQQAADQRDLTGLERRIGDFAPLLAELDAYVPKQYVPGTADVKTGDLVVTSGIDGIYPKGFVIGTIDHADRGVGAYHEIVIRPAVDFARLEEVLIVRTPPASRTITAEEPAK